MIGLAGHSELPTNRTRHTEFHQVGLLFLYQLQVVLPPIVTDYPICQDLSQGSTNQALRFVTINCVFPAT